MSQQEEQYTIGYGSVGQWMARRSFSREGAFFVPHIKPGMSVLDCGCGNGSITLGIAEAVAPGQVIGVDISEQQIDSSIVIPINNQTL